ncbi:hypothetical protein K435DRAFT_870634 [Dendrothele bispora CBS 962.96]|uniref:Uncharacterized protein n=1 Tax=Dendrothele bispora (strain CBS 962.96) TaxID=1314807 RepID=A0A4S8L665_DENBC|nr:hypothetical protein K435DRAFT_870634 [Dendrothele bispora CBS 962.96]
MIMIYVCIFSGALRQSSSKRLTLQCQRTTLWNALWNTTAECQGDGELLRSLQIRNAQTGSERDLAVNGLFHAPVCQIY